jgi:DNA-directed RNA polymerase subunit K/omega
VYTQAPAFLSPAVIPTTLLTKATPEGSWLPAISGRTIPPHVTHGRRTRTARERIPVHMTGHGIGNSFEFVVLASLRVRQLVDGCTPRVDGEGKKTTIAKREVLAGKVTNIAPVIPG